MATRTLAHYKKLLSSNPNATVGFTLAAQAVYASRHGEFNANSDDHNDEAYRGIARDLKHKYGENLTREQVETEMSAPETTEIRIRSLPVSVHIGLKHMAADERVSLNTLIVRLLTAVAK